MRINRQWRWIYVWGWDYVGLSFGCEFDVTQCGFGFFTSARGSLYWTAALGFVNVWMKLLPYDELPPLNAEPRA